MLLLLGDLAVTRGENKLPHAQYTLEPKPFTEYEPPIKLLLGGLIRGAPHPPNPPPMGGPKYILWVITNGPF